MEVSRWTQPPHLHVHLGRGVVLGVEHARVEADEVTHVHRQEEVDVRHLGELGPGEGGRRPGAQDAQMRMRMC